MRAARSAPRGSRSSSRSGRGLEGRRAVEQMNAHMREIGLDVRSIAGDPDPLRAVLEVYSPAEFDEIIVSTLALVGLAVDEVRAAPTDRASHRSARAPRGGAGDAEGP